MSEQIPITRSQQTSNTAATSNPMPSVVRQAMLSPEESVRGAAAKIDVELPSRGYFYPLTSPLSSGIIQMFEVTAKHEDILSNTALLKKGTVLDEFLKALIATSGVTLDELTVGDKNAIFLAARRSAYGDVYKTKMKCPGCEREVGVSIDLSMVTIKSFDFSNHERGQNQFTYTLPVSGKTIIWKMLTHKDESAIDGELKNLSKLSGVGSSPEVTTRLKYAIVSVDGKSDRSAIKAFVDNDLSAKDSLAFRTNVKSNTPDIDMTFDFVCPNCGHEARISIPLGANFFWPGVGE